jgi:hypothetical protein
MCVESKEHKERNELLARMRDGAILLLELELKRLITWYNPLGDPARELINCDAFDKDRQFTDVCLSYWQFVKIS